MVFTYNGWTIREVNGQPWELKNDTYVTTVEKLVSAPTVVNTQEVSLPDSLTRPAYLTLLQEAIDAAEAAVVVPPAPKIPVVPTENILNTLNN